MLGFFPSFGVDELLWSTLARYSVLLGNPRDTAFSTHILGSNNRKISVELPTGVGDFVSRLPPGHAMTAEVIAEQHTLLPYVVAFASPKYTQRTIEAIINHGRPSPNAGVGSQIVRNFAYLRACEDCMRDDDESCGAPTWRRAHQLPGVLVCSRHGRPLTVTRVGRVANPGTKNYVALAKEVFGAGRSVTVPREHEVALKRIADLSSGLLQTSAVGTDVRKFEQQIRGLLADFLVRPEAGHIGVSNLADAFIAHPLVNFIFREERISPPRDRLILALRKVLRSNESQKNPLLVFLILEVVGASIEDLEGNERVNEKGVLSQLRCANAVCPRYVKKFVPPVGFDKGCFFTCKNCGMTWNWYPKRPLTRTVRKAGPLWDGALKALAEDDDLELPEVARRLGVTVGFARNQAFRLGVVRPDWDLGPGGNSKRARRIAGIKERHRIVWGAFQATQPAGRLQDLRGKIRTARIWLKKYDREWFEQNTFYRFDRKASWIDWSKRDQEWTQRAQQIAEAIQAEGKGERITARLIAHALGAQDSVYENRFRLPLLWEFLRSCEPVRRNRRRTIFPKDLPI